MADREHEKERVHFVCLHVHGEPTWLIENTRKREYVSSVFISDEKNSD